MPGSTTFTWLEGGRFLVSLDDGVWRIWRDHPGFDQRFAATLGPDAVAGHWQVARTPDHWQDDLRVTDRRRDDVYTVT